MTLKADLSHYYMRHMNYMLIINNKLSEWIQLSSKKGNYDLNKKTIWFYCLWILKLSITSVDIQ